MTTDNHLFGALFVLLLGFLMFIMTIANKTLRLFSLLDVYFVLFLFASIVFLTLGIIMLFVWSFDKKRIFLEGQKETSFTPFIVFGIVLLLVGFTVIFYYTGLSKLLYIIAMCISITGIILLIPGLFYFIKEVITKKTALHS